MTIKDRILEYLKHQGYSKSSFYAKTGFSNGYLDSGGDIIAGRLLPVLENYPNLNLQWLLTGEGDILTKDLAINKTIQKRVQKVIGYLFEEGIAKSEDDIDERAELPKHSTKNLLLERTELTFDYVYRFALAYKISLNYLFYNRYPMFSEQ